MVKKKSLKSKKEKTNTTPAIFSYIFNFCINRKHQPEEFMPNKKREDALSQKQYTFSWYPDISRKTISSYLSDCHVTFRCPYCSGQQYGYCAPYFRLSG